MPHLTAICKAIDFVEDHLKEEITVADMADAASYSLYHFCRTFNRVVHHTPYDYLMRRRLSESARELVEGDKKIIEVALDYRFNSPETYSRAFKRMFGIQPYRWKKQEGLDGRALMPRFTPRHLRHINKGDYLRPVLKEREGFCVAGVMTLVQDGRTVLDQLWQVLGQKVEELEAPEPRNYYGIAWYPRDWERRGFFYMAALEVESPYGVGPALAVKVIPPLKYSRFIHKGPRADLELTLDYVYQTWLPKSGERLAYALEIECYGAEVGDVEREEAEWEVYVPIE
jgi:AraC family transcriptional regulator